MFYYDIINQISFLITACLSLIILSIVLCFNKDSLIIKLIGSSFSIPFILVLVSFLSSNAGRASFLLIYSDILLLLSLSLVFSKKSTFKNSNVFQLVLIIIPIVFLVLTFYSKSFSLLLDKSYIFLTLFLTFCIINLFLLRKEKGNDSLLFWGVLLLTFSLPIRELLENSLFLYLSLIFKFSAYSMFFLYSYKEIYSKIMVKVIEADKKLDTINRSLNLEVKKRVFEIEQSNQKLVSISKTDALTKALNKKAIMDSIEDLIISKPNSIFSIIMFDIDNFKTVNDTLGHIVGDKCIKKVATIAFNCIRDIDNLGRYGGDEFIILLPGSTSLQSKIIAERFRKRVDDSDPPHFTVSIGISTFPNDGSNVKELISSADDGLYISKKKGKNAVSHKNIY